MKKLVLLLMVLFTTFTLVGCKKEPIVDDKEKDVESVQITFEQSVLQPGTYTLTAICLPEESSQLVKFSLVGNPSGITLSGTELVVSVNAIDKEKFSVRATSLYDPTISTTKEFTIDNPEELIEIKTEDDLLAINTSEGLTKKYILMNDITLTKKWEPIGVADVELDNGEIVKGEYFMGSFDGQGFTISGIDIEGEFTVGFFAQIGSTGIVKNTHFEGSVQARGWSGGIAGINEGLITNSISSIDVTVLGGSAGAIVSVNRGTISYTYATGITVAGTANTEARSTGLVAANEGQLIEVYGDKDAMTTPNYIAFTPVLNEEYMLSTSLMKTAKTFEEWDIDVWFIVDGFYPLLKHEGFQEPDKEISIIITNENLEIDVEEVESLEITTAVINGDGTTSLVYSLKEAVEGVEIDSETGIVTFTTEVVHLSTFTVVVSLSDDEEVFASKTFTIIYNPVPVEDVIYITNADELINLATQTNLEALSKTYKLANDIVLETWFNNSIGTIENPFTGIFDGQGFSIKGLKGGDGKHNFGLFGAIGSDGVVKNLSIEGAGRDADLYVGAAGAVVASENKGLIENVIVDVNILSTGNWVAGFVANNYGTIKNSILLGKARRNDSLEEIAPGFAISNEGSIENSFVDKTTSGAVSFLNEASELDEFLLETTQMQTASNFESFDQMIWNIVDGEYPSLKTIE